MAMMSRMVIVTDPTRLSQDMMAVATDPTTFLAFSFLDQTYLQSTARIRIPEPGTFGPLGTGLLGYGYWRRRQAAKDH